MSSSVLERPSSPATGPAPLRLGPLTVDPAVVLAPMAGITNPAFRTLCREFGAGLYVCEMITTRALVERNAKTLKMVQAAPGEADLTAHVDFKTLARAAAPARATAMIGQGDLLERLGIGQRAQVLARGLEGERLAAHLAAHRRLTLPEEMGTLFKAMAFHPSSAPPPAGFAP